MWLELTAQGSIVRRCRRIFALLCQVHIPILIFAIQSIVANSIGRVQAQGSLCDRDEATLNAALSKTAMEVNLLAQRALDNHYNCDLLNTCGVSRPLAVLACSNITPGIPVGNPDLTCVTTVEQTNVTQCGQQSCHNEFLSFKYSAMKLPPGTSIDRRTGLRPDSYIDYRAAVCRQTFTDLFQRMVLANTSLFGNWRYFTDPLGVFSKYPFQSVEQIPSGSANVMQCAPYDARQRPWFAGSISSRKALIILIDTGDKNDKPALINGGSTSKLQLSQQVASALLNTLQENDAVAVIAFNENVTVLDTGKLLFLKDFDIPRVETRSLLNAVKALQVSSGNSSGLHMAVQIGLGLARDFGDGCQKILLILSAGENLGAFPAFDPVAINQSIVNAASLQNQSITPFFVSVGEEVSGGDVILQSLACSTNGIWMRVPNSDNVLFYMYGYFNFLARTSQFVNETYISKNYTDFSGLGLVFTMARLVFDNVTGDWLGTAAGDTSIDALFGATICPTAKNRVYNRALQSVAYCPAERLVPPCLIPAIRTSIIRMSQNYTPDDNLNYCPTPVGCIIPPVVERCSDDNVTDFTIVPPGQAISPRVNYCCGTCTAPL